MLPALLPLFPLPRVVLFPRTFLPLHIFEPRYRQMTAEILASHRHLLMVLTRDPDGSELVPVEAPTFETATLARVVRAELMEDGRWNLLLQGRQTMKILEEVEGEPYRRARVEPLAFDGDTPWDPAPLLVTLARYADRMELEPQIKQLLDLDLAPSVLLNTLAFSLDLEPVEKQFLLEAPSLAEFARRLQQLLQFALDDRDLPGLEL